MDISLPSSFATFLRDSPALRNFRIIFDRIDQGDLDIFERLDELKQSSEDEGKINSYIHGKEEILHARLLLDFRQVSDLPLKDAGDRNCDPDCHGFGYRTADGQIREKVFTNSDQEVWYDIKDYRGQIFPNELLEEMRKVEGSSEKEWTAGRGIAISSKAFAVMNRWTAENAAT